MATTQGDAKPALASSKLPDGNPAAPSPFIGAFNALRRARAAQRHNPPGGQTRTDQGSPESVTRERARPPVQR
jgi:hypothetical protein